MSITLIIILILLGIFLFMVEFLLIPGVTVAGIGGAVLLVAAVVLAYRDHGTTVGTIVLVGTFLLFVGAMVMMLKGRTWKSISLSTAIESKVNTPEEEQQKVKAGDTGTTLTRLNPIGKVKIGEQVYEGRSLSGYLDAEEEVEVVRISGHTIVVKPKNT